MYDPPSERIESRIRLSLAVIGVVAILAAFANIAHAAEPICPVKVHHKAHHHKPRLVMPPAGIPAPEASPLPTAVVPLCFKPDEPLEPVGGGVYRYYTVSLAPDEPAPELVYVPSPLPGWMIPVGGGYITTRAVAPAVAGIGESPIPTRAPYTRAPGVPSATPAPELDANSCAGCLSLMLGLSAVIKARKRK